MKRSLIFRTDSYKLGHWQQYPKNTEKVYSYFESRNGAKFYETVFFGLQYLLQMYLMGPVVTKRDIQNAETLSKSHFESDKLFNKDGWNYILNNYSGMLPIRIKAIPEGTPVPVSNVLMSIENTDCYSGWLTNALESLLTKVWAPSTVATLSRETKRMIRRYLSQTSDNESAIKFMLHDFGYRGVSSEESAEICGAAHLLNFFGTDTVPAMICALDHYDADINNLAFSVPATEHSIMTAMGEAGEPEMVDHVLETYPTGIVSIVADSYNIYNFVSELICKKFKQKILNRNGICVIRPDSVSQEHPTPQGQVHWILDELWDNFGGIINNKGYRVLDSHVKVLWGDGIDFDGIENILSVAEKSKFSAENLVFGMGGGLLQKVNRDTQRFAFKSSAQMRNGVWHDVYKKPKDLSKASKRGRLMLVKGENGFETIQENDLRLTDDCLQTVFENGLIVKRYSFDEIRNNAQL